MNKKFLIIIVLVAAIAFIFVLTRGRSPAGPTADTEMLPLEESLSPVSLTPEERQIIEEKGLKPAASDDASARELQRVRVSDELDSIEADLEGTDLSGLDMELQEIQRDLSGL